MSTNTYSRGIHSLPVINVTDDNGNDHNVFTINQAKVVAENGTYTVWTWKAESYGFRFRTGLTSEDAHALAVELTSRVS